ncbi:hypothetical protein [Legionella yabuuchiae]|uniref:hypothetical protein n=1 Tax=Legionella yabuuchiae TaxID=376727 RepID=UPI001055C3FD|nr:hypothetical protein [Legionella yabuuchiae]
MPQPNHWTNLYEQIGVQRSVVSLFHMMPGSETLDSSIQKEFDDFFDGTNGVQRRKKAPTATLVKANYETAIWKDTTKTTKESWYELVKAILSIETAKFYNREKKDYFDIKPFNDIIAKHIDVLNMDNEDDRKKLFSLLKVLVGRRLTVCILVEKPPFPKLKTSLEVAENCFLKLKNEFIPSIVSIFEANEDKNGAFNSSLERIKNYSREAGTYKQITGYYIEDEIVACGTEQQGKSPKTLWNPVNSAQRASLYGVLAMSVSEDMKKTEYRSFNPRNFTNNRIRKQLAGTVGVGQFDCRVALAILFFLKHRFNHETQSALDPMGGWGERLIAFMAYMQHVQNSDQKITVVDQNSKLAPNIYTRDRSKCVIYVFSFSPCRILKNSQGNEPLLAF